MSDDLLTTTKNNLLISQNDNFKTINELIFKIEDIINNEDLTDEELDELDFISEVLSERNYYSNTNK